MAPRPDAGRNGLALRADPPSADASGRGVAAELRLDPAFVEEAVFLELHRLTLAGNRQTAASFHRQREAVYELSDGPQRDDAFQRLAHRMFQTLGLAELFTARLAEFPRVSDQVELIIIRRVWTKKDEQVEWYVDRSREAQAALHASTTLFIGLQAARCLDREPLTAFLRHELMHVDDMLDPLFAYDPHAAFGEASEPEREVIRARFRALWDVWVDARMRRRGWPTLLDEAVRDGEAARAFAFLGPAEQQTLLAAVRQRHDWTQDELLAQARGTHIEAIR